ncbi:uncharacterized protein ISCGN_032053 [Ixodes scapularis]
MPSTNTRAMAGAIPGVCTTRYKRAQESGWILANDHLKKITGDKRLLKDVGQMSSHGQTYALEAFHSVLINFAPKSQAFSPAGMLARTRLAILHYNKTSDRCQAVTQQGDPCFTVTTSKARKGHATAREKKTNPTYEYVGKLVQEVMASNEQCTSLDEAAIAKKRIFPAPMNAAFTRPSKRELVEARRSRFGQVTP